MTNDENFVFKDLEATLSIRNNQLKERRLKLGLSQPDFAALLEIRLDLYRELEKLQRPPWKAVRMGRGKKVLIEGDWSDEALCLSAFHKVPPEMLFPEAVLAVEKSVQVMKLTTEDLQPLLAKYHAQLPALPAPDQELEAADRKRLLEDMLLTLTPVQRRILELRFYEDKCQVEIGPILFSEKLVAAPISVARVGHLEAQALRCLRHPSRAHQLLPAVTGMIIPGQSGPTVGEVRGARRADLIAKYQERVAEHEKRKTRQAGLQDTLALRRERHAKKLLEELAQRYRARGASEKRIAARVKKFDDSYVLAKLEAKLGHAWRYGPCPHCYKTLRDGWSCANCGWADVYRKYDDR